MRLSWVGRWCAPLLVVAGWATARAEEPRSSEPPASKPSLLDPFGLFKSSKPAAPKPPAEDTKPKIDESTKAADELAARLGRELENYRRRLEVCVQLREIADQTGDAALERTVDQLEDRAWAVYQQRLAELQPSAGTERLLDKHERAPATASRGSGSNTARSSREVKP